MNPNIRMKRQRHLVMICALVFCTFILGVVAAMNVKNSVNLHHILTESVKGQLISTSLAAREMLDVDAFASYRDESAAQDPAYQEVLHKLRTLADSVGAKYIYALKRQGDHYVFVFDTDVEDPTIFIPYELSPVHVTAFSGRNVADIMNVKDEYGSFNTGAVPIFHKGKVIGVICTDIEDTYLESSYQTALFNSLMLIGILLLTMGAMLFSVYRLLRRIGEMQGQLERQALYDTITGLPNRQYLMEQLTSITSGPNTEPFALFFIDLDNFKQVNDSAGHDAGDDVLRQIARFLDTTLDNARAFRPSAGKLNIAARVGGDEFIQVVEGLNSVDEVREAAEHLLESFKTADLSRYIEKYNVGLSIGVARYPYDSKDYHVLIKYADVAMYHAKHGGKNQYRIYTDEMGQEK
ncbi:diguanylate cyclase [Oxalobacter sp. OttesenSCG-928-P03]|nr:diguanylate cyclase [Oxalobacter sp. OttesenSCG-928-P03]